MEDNRFQFAVLTEKGKAVIKEDELPELGADEVLIKQEACNICTTDYQQWQGKREHQGYPMAGGHECSGLIVKKGGLVSDNIEIGDHISVIYDYCGKCESCKKGKITNCENIEQFGKNYSTEYYGIFGFANYFIRKEKSVVKISETLTATEGGFVEPLSSVIRGVKKLKINSGIDNVVIIGAGTMGLLNALVAKHFGANVTISERNPKKVEKARRMGFKVYDVNEVDPVEEIYKDIKNGPDIVIIAVGTNSANEQALKLIREDEGKILFFAAGYPVPELDIDSNLIHYREFELIGTYGSSLQDFKEAANLLSNKKINVKDLVEMTYPLSEIQQAFEKASTRGSYRVSVILN